MNILQAYALATLAASLARIQMSDENIWDRGFRESLNIVFFAVWWFVANDLNPYLPEWARSIT